MANKTKRKVEYYPDPALEALQAPLDLAVTIGFSDAVLLQYEAGRRALTPTQRQTLVRVLEDTAKYLQRLAVLVHCWRAENPFRSALLPDGTGMIEVKVPAERMTVRDINSLQNDLYQWIGTITGRDILR